MARSIRAAILCVALPWLGCSASLIGDPGTETPPPNPEAGPDATADSSSDASEADVDGSAAPNTFRDVKGIAAFGQNVYVSHGGGVARCGPLSAESEIACEHAVVQNTGAIVVVGSLAHVVSGAKVLRCGEGSAQFRCDDMRTIPELATAPPARIAITDDLTVLWTSTSNQILFRAPPNGAADGSFDTGRTAAPIATAGNRIFVGQTDGTREYGVGTLQTAGGFVGAAFLATTLKRLGGASSAGFSFIEIENDAGGSIPIDGPIEGFALTDAASYWTLPSKNEIVRATNETSPKLTRRSVTGGRPKHIAAATERIWYTVESAAGVFALRTDAP